MSNSNYRDISTQANDLSAGFQFEFYCERCGESQRSAFSPYRRGQMTGWLSRLLFAFRDLHNAFRKANTLVIGVSRDSCASHQKFKTKEKLNYELLSDADEGVCKMFDVIKEKNMYGKKVLGIERSTFLIDEDGVLAHAWRKVKADGHAADVLAAAKAL